MPPKSKPHSGSQNIYIVLSSSGIDSVYSSLPTAQERAPVAKAEGLTGVRVEVWSVIDDQSSTASSTASAPKTVISANAIEAKANSGGDGVAIEGESGDKVKTPAKGTKQTPKAERKPRESKAKNAKAKDDAAAATSTPAPAPAQSKSGKDQDSEPSSSTAQAPESTSTPDPTKAKTVSADEQRAINAKQKSKSADEDLPANVQALLKSKSTTLKGETVIVTGVPPTIGRKNTEELVKAHGGKLGSSITGNTSLVVLGNKAGPKKLDQIKEFSIETIDEDGLVKRLEAAGAGKKRPAQDDANDVAADDSKTDAPSATAASGDGGEKKKARKSKKAKE